jgi:hypothetical protein
MSRNRIFDYMSGSDDRPISESDRKEPIPTGFIEIQLDLLPIEMRQGMLENQHLYEIAYRQARAAQE